MIDLNNLETGDSVTFTNGTTALFLEQKQTREIDYPLNVSLYCNGNLHTIGYRYDGKSMYDNMHIVSIIKNPKQWTDEDMKMAFKTGNEYTRFSVDDESAEQWVEEYRLSK
jgi:hypothetical protein